MRFHEAQTRFVPDTDNLEQVWYNNFLSAHLLTLLFIQPKHWSRLELGPPQYLAAENEAKSESKRIIVKIVAQHILFYSVSSTCSSVWILSQEESISLSPWGGRAMVSRGFLVIQQNIAKIWVRWPVTISGRRHQNTLEQL